MLDALPNLCSQTIIAMMIITLTLPCTCASQALLHVLAHSILTTMRQTLSLFRFTAKEQAQVNSIENKYRTKIQIYVFVLKKN